MASYVRFCLGHLVALSDGVKLYSLPLVALTLSLGATQVRADIVWETDYEKARIKALKTGKPLFIDVYTDWCGWCKRLDSDVYPDPRVQQMARNYVMLKLNAEGGGRAFAEAMKVTGYPSLMFVSSRGELYHQVGYVEPNGFLAIMGDALRRNGAARLQAVSPATKAKTPPRRMSLAPGARNWKKQPELQRAVNGAGYGGALLLGDEGVVAVERTAKKKTKKR